jgi:hypothetical protein
MLHAAHSSRSHMWPLMPRCCPSDLHSSQSSPAGRHRRMTRLHQWWISTSLSNVKCRAKSASAAKRSSNAGSMAWGGQGAADVASGQ